MQTINNYIDENKERFLDELFGLLRIPSISSVKSHKPDMYRAAEYWKDLLLSSGADKAEIYETDGNP
ncbi:MAG: M20 family dipeptidase, partial [Bacteroidales bacterium]|nr:M20 family dipeptidase [Bacteroidales bacterium]